MLKKQSQNIFSTYKYDAFEGYPRKTSQPFLFCTADTVELEKVRKKEDMTTTITKLFAAKQVVVQRQHKQDSRQASSHRSPKLMLA